MRRLLQVIGALAVIFLIAAQFVGPRRHNRRVDPAQTIEARTGMPASVAAILHRACRDCHTEETDWQWYGHIAPTSWLQEADVYAARRHVNFSEWGKYTPEEQSESLREMCNQVRSHSMPLWYYRILHYPSASISAGDVQTLCGWTGTELQKLNVPTGEHEHEP